MSSEETAVELSADVYTEALRVWVETSSKSAVCCETGLKRKQVTKLLDVGIPELDLPPIKGQDPDNAKPAPARKRKVAAPPIATAADRRRHAAAKQAAAQQIAQMKAAVAELEGSTADAAARAELAETRERLEQTDRELQQAEKKLELEQKRIDQVTDRAVNADLIEVSATEAALARSAMQSAMNVAAVIEHMSEQLLTAVAEGRVTMPTHIDMKTLKALTAATEKSTATIERAIKIEKGKAGQNDENNDAFQISVILSACTPKELEEIAKNGGIMPERIRNLVTPGDLEQT